jgi:hypothetical protein
MKFSEEIRIAQIAIDADLQAIERRHQCFRDVAAAEGTEATARIGIRIVQCICEQCLRIALL